jgi:hypothetical protein
MKDMKIWNAGRNEYELRNVKRFNDRYQSVFGMAEAGVENKKWADYFFVGMSQSVSTNRCRQDPIRMLFMVVLSRTGRLIIIL